MRSFFALVLAATLAGCAHGEGQGSVPLTIATWNMEHLGEANGSGCEPRTDGDYQAMGAFVAAIDADVIAFQEVESVAAAARVFDPARYEIVIEERTGSGNRAECRDRPGYFLNRQATGFAIRRGIRFERLPDLAQLQVGSADLRSGVDIIIRPEHGQPIRLLSVHLKSGCPAGATSNDCPTLFNQVPVLEQWIDARAAAGERFAILGDFNRRLGLEGDVVWADWDDAKPPNLDLSLAAGAAAATCNPRFPAFIDHIVLDHGAAETAVGFHEWTYSGRALSDHCPVSVTIGADR